MKRHFCPMDHVWIEYEGECNWCGEKEIVDPMEEGYDSPWAPTDEDTRGDYEHDIYRQRELDDERN